MIKKDSKSAPRQSQQLNKKKRKKKEKGPQQEFAWWFQPDEENPFLNPKVLQKEGDYEPVIRILQHEADNCPTKNAPPKKLLTLVGRFLTSYGFNSPCRLFQLQCNARNKLDGWDTILGEELPKDHPDLLQIYKEWEKNDRTTELPAHGDGLETTKEFKDQILCQDDEDDYTSSSGITTSEDDSNSRDSDVEILDWTLKSANGAKEKKKSASTSSSSSSFSSNSNSDTDDKKESVVGSTTASKPTLKKSSDAAKWVVSGLSTGLSSDRNRFKRKTEPQAKKSDKLAKKPKRVESTSSSLSSAASESDSNSNFSATSSVAVKRLDDPILKNLDRSIKQMKALGELIRSQKASKAAMSTSSDGSGFSSIDSDVPAKQADTKSKSTFKSKSKSKSKSKATLKVASPTECSLSSSSSSDSDSSSGSSSSLISNFNPSPKPAKASIDSNLSKTPSDSTATIVADSPGPSSSARVLTRKRTHSPSTDAAIKKAKPQRFQRVPRDTAIDNGFESNRYQSYDYADRAHKNLSTVKGNKFTKEKNKQKRKDYRGGMIDIAGSRGVKFE